MDILFHAASATLLGRVLGERRPSRLWLAAGIGVIPDVVSITGRLSGVYIYSFAHSLTFQLPIVLILLLLNWRIAFGGLLHILMDIPTHQYATTYLFYPFAKWNLPVGIAWYQGIGIMTWALLWITLVALILLYWMDQKARDNLRPAPVPCVKALEERACPSPHSPQAD